MGLNRTRIAVACALWLAAGASAHAANLPACAGGVEIARARVVRVEQNGVLVLADGRALILEGIRLPMGEADHAATRLAEEARSSLLTMARSGTITGTAIPPKQDRYDRVRVQAFSDNQWLQRTLLVQGLARVSISPDRVECAADFYEFEKDARTAGRGIWAIPAYRVRTDRDDWHPDIGTFQLIEGKVARVTTRDGDTVLDFSSDGRSGLKAVISGADRRKFRSGLLEELAGHRLRLRGIVQESGGRPMIAVSNLEQIQLLD